MSAPANPPRSAGDQLHAAWRHIVREDESEPDFERIAAFIDGGLSRSAEAVLAEQITESPRVFSLLMQLLPEGQSLPRSLPDPSATDDGTPAAEASPKTEQTESAPPATSERPRSTEPTSKALWSSLAAAAALLLAVGFGWAWSNTRDQLSQARLDLDAADALGEALVAAEKLQLAQASSLHQPVYLGGKVSSGLLPLSLSTAGGSRAVEEPTKLESLRLQQGLDSAQAAVEHGGTDTLAGLIERAVLSTFARRFDDADELLTQLEQKNPEAPEVLNARGVWLATRAGELNLAESQQSLEDASQKFRNAAEGGLAIGWLNLALLHASRGEFSEARSVAETFVEETDDDDARETVTSWIADSL